MSKGNVIVLKRGHSIKLAGKAAKKLDTNTHAATYSIKPPNFIGMTPIPKVLVEVGDEVKAGDILFYDKKNPDVKYASPVSGEVAAITRGAKRSIAEITVIGDKEIAYRNTQNFNWQGAKREELIQYLLGTGLWPLIIQRPYDTIADPSVDPKCIYISTFDTAPLAPDLDFVIEGKGAAFQKGLDVLSKLTSGKVHLGLNGNKGVTPNLIYSNATGVEKHWFQGVHPTGNVGVQLHHVAPIGAKDKVWVLGVQEVAQIGRFFIDGKFDAERIVALTGAEVKEPRYFRTFQGANIENFVKGNLKTDHNRFVAGDVLTGKNIGENGSLNFHDDQITVLVENDQHELFGWLLPLKPRPSVSRTFPWFFARKEGYHAETNTHGEGRAFVMTGQYEKVLPMDIYPQHLMKAILVNDFEKMEGLGIYELSEEDVALCEFVCTSKQPLQQILRKGHDVMREQS